MSIKAILFDLDGTLLPMDQDKFVKAYFSLLAEHLAPHGYDPKELVGEIWRGTEAMVRNKGDMTNEEAFWTSFAAHYGDQVRSHEPIFAEFYETKFEKVGAVLGYDPKAAETVKALRGMGLRLILATNPIFPAAATKIRIKLAGLEENDFELVTTYENSRHCKPNPDYYRDILEKAGLTADECIMVGNDTVEDIAASARVGIKSYLLTACIINKDGIDPASIPSGDFDGLMQFIRESI